MLKNCRQCKTQFEITDSDLKFYEKISPVFEGKKYQVPAPTLCPDCRRQRRLAFRNERKLYNRKCDLTGKQLISMYSPDKKYKVYDHKEWWKDTWDATNFGKDFDFDRPFFEQFAELWHEVPQMNIKSENNENSDYCNLIANCKNCYLVFESSNNEDCLYGYWLQKCTNCTDCSFSHDSHQCYEVDNCYNCYNLKWSQNCNGCSDSAFLNDCIGCKNCLFSVNLRQKEYCIFNKQYSKEEYKILKEKYLNGSYSNLSKNKQEFEKFLLEFPHRYAQFLKAENCSGDYIQQSKNCEKCFHAHDAEDCKYGEHVWRNSKDNMDVSTVGRDAELIYESINTALNAKHDLFCIQCWSGTSDLIYCVGCFSSQNCFGCLGLRHKQYCILNKQYTKEEYEKIVPKIIEQMKKTNFSGSNSGDFGEFFPMKISEYCYNETVANEQFPLTKEQILKLGLGFKEEDFLNKYEGPKIQIPDNVAEVKDDLLKAILSCDGCEKNYRIIKQELAFYKKENIPLPHFCPDCRHKQRMSKRNPLQLWDRKCAKCSAKIKTTYSPDRLETVYCEKCYLNTIY